jgi:hypothetical protein
MPLNDTVALTPPAAASAMLVSVVPTPSDEDEVAMRSCSSVRLELPDVADDVVELLSDVIDMARFLWRGREQMATDEPS